MHLVVEFLRVGQRQLVPTHNKWELRNVSNGESHIEQNIYQCYRNVTIFMVLVPTSVKLRFRLRLLTSYGSGSGSLSRQFSEKFWKKSCVFT